MHGVGWAAGHLWWAAGDNDVLGAVGDGSCCHNWGSGGGLVDNGCAAGLDLDLAIANLVDERGVRGDGGASREDSEDD